MFIGVKTCFIIILLDSNEPCFFIKNDILFTIKGAGSMGDVEIYKYAQ